MVIMEPKKIKSVTVSIVSSSICHEVMGPDAMIFARPSGVPRGPATFTGSLASQRHPGKFPKVPG